MVTGASSGIGRATAEILVELGAEVVGVDILAPTVAGVAEWHHLDLADETSTRRCANDITSGERQVHGLFNVAGVPGTADPAAIIAVNFVGLRRFTEALVPSMPPGSAICSVGSTAAVNWQYHVDELTPLVSGDEVPERFTERLPRLGYPYDVSKEAVNVYTCWRSASLNDVGIRINCVNPGGTRTPASREFTRAVKAKVGGSEMIAHWPKLMGRMARPAEQAWPLVYLNSPLASFITGASLYVDAGLTAGLVTRQHHPAIAAGMFWGPPRTSSD